MTEVTLTEEALPPKIYFRAGESRRLEVHELGDEIVLTAQYGATRYSYTASTLLDLIATYHGLPLEKHH